MFDGLLDDSALPEKDGDEYPSVDAILTKVLNAASEADVREEYCDLAHLLENNPPLPVVNHLPLKWLPRLVGSVSSSVRTWAVTVLEGHPLLTKDPPAASALLSESVHCYLNLMSEQEAEVVIASDPSDELLFPDEDEDLDDHDGIPPSHDPAVLWYAVYYLIEIGGADTARDVAWHIVDAAKNEAYLQGCKGDGESSEEAKGWFLKALLAVGAVAADGVEEFTRPWFQIVFDLVVPSNVALLCEFVALHPSSVLQGHIDVLLSCKSPVADFLALAPLSAIPGQIGETVSATLWQKRSVQELLTGNTASEAAEVCVAVAGRAVQSVLNVIQEWGRYLARVYESLRRGKKPEVDGTAISFPRVDLLFNGVARSWGSLPLGSRQQMCDAVLPLAALLDATAVDHFLRFTRLGDAGRLPAQCCATPLQALTAICASVDSIASSAFSDMELATSTNIMRAAFLLAPQHSSAHTAVIPRDKSASEALVTLVSQSRKARQWVGVALRACCALGERKENNADMVADVMMSMFVRSSTGVINGLLEGLYPYVEDKYVHAVLMSAQRCMGIWRCLGLSFETVMLGVVSGVSTGPWCQAVLRLAKVAESDAERDKWAVAVSALADQQIYDGRDSRALFGRVLKSSPLILAAIKRVSLYTPAAARLIAWGEGREYIAPQPKTPEKPASQGSLRAQYSISMLDDSDDVEEVEMPPPPPSPKAAPQQRKSYPTPSKVIVIDDGEDEENFVKMAKKVLAPAPRMPRMSRSELEMRKLAKAGGLGSQVQMEMQPCGAALVYDRKPREARTANVHGQSRALVPKAFNSSAVARADKKFLDMQRQQREGNIKRLRDHRYPRHKLSLLNAMLEIGQTPSEALQNLPKTFVSEDHYANMFFSFIMYEARESLERSLQFLGSGTPDSGAIVEIIHGKHEVVIEFPSRPVNAFNDTSLIAVKSEDMSYTGSQLIIGKVETYFRAHNQIQVRFTPSDYRTLTMNLGLCVQPVENISSVFQMAWVINNLAYLPLYRHLLTGAPMEDEATRERRRTVYIAQLPPAFSAHLEKHYNELQRSAILNSCAQREGFSLIQGPPGTGKTHTLMGLLSLLLLKGKNCHLPRCKHILVVAPSNTACDEIAVRIGNKGLVNADGVTYSPKMLRAGVRAKVHPDVRPVYVEDIVDMRQEDKEKTRSNIEQKYRQMQRSLATEEDALRGMETTSVPVDPALLFNQKEKVRLLHANLRIEVKRRKARAKIAEEDRRAERVKVINEAAIVCSTLASCRNLPPGFDAIVVDESAQAVEPEVLLALKSGAKQCILVGDDKQLRATILSQPCKKNNYGRSLFERLREGGHAPHLLRTQYRMHPSIRAFPSSEFYENKLMDNIVTVKRPALVNILQPPLPDAKKIAPVLAYSVLNVEGRCQMNLRSKSSYNIEEAEVVSALIQRITSELGIALPDIGVITPYKEQVKMIQAKTLGVEVNTVDSFQGREKRAVIISCVRAVGQSGLGFAAEAERMNVALTRGKELLIVVCHCRTMTQSPLFGRLILNAARRGVLFSESASGASLQYAKNPSIKDLNEALSSLERTAVNRSQGASGGRRRVQINIEDVERKASQEGRNDERRAGGGGEGGGAAFAVPVDRGVRGARCAGGKRPWEREDESLSAKRRRN